MASGSASRRRKARQDFGGILEPVEEQGPDVGPIGQNPGDLEDADAVLDRGLGRECLPDLAPGLRLRRRWLQDPRKDAWAARPSIIGTCAASVVRTFIVHLSQKVGTLFARELPWPTSNRSWP